jgi:hypothetical protein
MKRTKGLLLSSIVAAIFLHFTRPPFFFIQRTLHTPSGEVTVLDNVFINIHLLRFLFLPGLIAGFLAGMAYREETLKRRTMVPLLILCFLAIEEIIIKLLYNGTLAPGNLGVERVNFYYDWKRLFITFSLIVSLSFGMLIKDWVKSALMLKSLWVFGLLLFLWRISFIVPYRCAVSPPDNEFLSFFLYYFFAPIVVGIAAGILFPWWGILLCFISSVCFRWGLIGVEPERSIMLRNILFANIYEASISMFIAFIASLVSRYLTKRKNDRAAPDYQ